MRSLRATSAVVLISVAASLTVTLTATLSHALRVRRTVATPCDDVLSSLQVAAYARNGRLESSAAVTARASFNLFLKLATTTHYVLHLLAAIQNQYHPIMLQVDPDHVLLSHVRPS
ncbi:hypothetical protein BWQ96_10292 [Gracilariopsis chorda]|uniref:Uncharacterized protein n=1 Tax=Gracilariopsis chorda TaxID=448386 RepID=A0A2V3IFP9_9FLOR|nr:hypothetical protein BWQ96_10292 [Gracilariopsis chorda]|eukprot:PXF40000.1 hypothetical protein BWQ96_10292 [Gracilariopsis chorda]